METMARLTPFSKPVDKVKSDGAGDVTIGLDVAKVTHLLREDLTIEDQAQEEPTAEKQYDMTIRVKKHKHNSYFVYFSVILIVINKMNDG